MAFTPHNIAATQNLNGVKLSPDGSKIVYHVRTPYKDGDHATAALWYSSDTTKAESAKQLTSGLYDDEAPVWHPNPKENTIYFLSDRHKHGGPKQLYKYSLDGPGEPSLIDDSFKEKKRQISYFQVSPNGHYVAFCSADEPSAEDEKEDKEKDDARVWGENKEHARLRLYTLSTGEIRTLVKDQEHVAFCTWSPDSKELIYGLHKLRSDMEARLEVVRLFIISIRPFPPSSTPVLVTTFHHMPMGGSIIWPSGPERYLFEIQPYHPHYFTDAAAVFSHSLDPESPYYSGFRHVYLGETEDAGSLLDLRRDGGEFAVEVVTGISTRVDILNKDGRMFTLFETGERMGVQGIDVKKVGNEYILACIRSSGPYKEPPNVWVGKVEGKDKLIPEHSLSLATKLSSHFSWMESSKLGNVEIFEWEGEDGTALNGIAWFPQGIDPANVKKPLPTILHVHGGPYYRDTPDLQPSFVSWNLMLAEQGYLVLCPNYRGSSGRGHAFARAAHHGVGTLEWSDVDAMVEEAVKRGLADKDKLGLGGWSQGGFMTAWGVSQTKTKLQCGVMGAGVSDWGAMATESDIPDLEADIGGAAPWWGASARLAGDAIRHVKDVETATLILHGERDVRVPVGQAVGFHRGLRRMSKYPERHTLVVYPREGHGFTERKHAEDVLKRVISHYEAWLK